MKEIYINADDYNTDSIKTIQGNNNAEEYKIYLQYDNEKIDLTGKTVNLGFLRVGSTEGDIIENLNVTNPKEGEITLKITNKISKRNGTYSCQLAILGEGDFLEHTATFTLTVENNIFSDITKAIADSKDFTYLERILEEAKTVSGELKETVDSVKELQCNIEIFKEANTLVKDLNDNTLNANNANSKLIENTSKAESVSVNLDSKNIEATSKIERLEGLNNKAEELSNNINEALPVKDALIKNTESAKVANTNLLAANQEATSKNTELQASLEKTKEFIEGLDGSQNIPQIRIDVTELQNGLKSNQALAYKGSSVVADNTLEGRTEGMIIKGRTLVNLVNSKKIRDYQAIGGAKSDNDTITWDFDNGNILYNSWNFIYDTLDMCEVGKTYTAIFNVLENTTEIIKTGEKTGISVMNWNVKNGGNTWAEGDCVLKGSGIILKKFTFEKGNFEKSKIAFNVNGREDVGNTPKRLRGKFVLSKKIMILEGDWTNKEISSYFEGLKSFGEVEKVGDKYKISILSHGKNLVKKNSFTDNEIKKWNGSDESYYVETIDCGLKKGTVWGLIKSNGDLRYELSFGNNPIDITTHESIANTREKVLHYINGSARNQLDKDYKYAVISVRKLSQSANISKVMISNFETDYEPYKCYKKDLLIKKPLGEWDYIYEDSGQVKVYRETFIYTFNGDEDIDFYTINTNFEKGNFTFVYNLKKEAKNSTITDIKNLICDTLTAKNGNNWDEFGKFIQVNNNRIVFSMKGKEYKGVNDFNEALNIFKAWLKANPTTIAYQLAEPVVEVVENCVDIDLDTFREKTYFNILNSLQGTLDFKVPSNIASIVQNTAREVNNIWDVINNLLVPSIVKANGNLAMIKLNNNLK